MAALIVAAVFVGVVVFAWESDWGLPFARSIVRPMARRTYHALAGVILDPWVYAGWVAIASLEILMPARRGQPLVSRGLSVDAAYTILMIAFKAALLPVYVALLQRAYRTHFSFLTLELAEPWPWGVRALLGYLAVDLLGYLHHVVRHKVGAFWTFHAVHHSQREMNLFTNERNHPVDYLIAQTVRFVPFFALETSFGLIMSYHVFFEFHDRLNHANVRTNLGPLRYIFVTPQSHRIHHSISREHYDSNFGVSLSVWDRLFGTQHPSQVDYPETGVPDALFPSEQDGSHHAVPGYLAAQFVYPFRALWRQARPARAT